MTATERLRQLLDERGVEWHGVEDSTYWGEVLLTRRDGSDPVYKFRAHKTATNRLTAHLLQVTPEQAVEATLGAIPRPNPTWERWLKSLKHDEVKTIDDAVEQLMYEAIEFGGDMGPNGNVYNGIDEGDVLTAGFINEWVAKFEATLGSDEVADLRQALADLWPRASFTMCPENRDSWLERLAELGVEVES